MRLSKHQLLVQTWTRESESQFGVDLITEPDFLFIDEPTSSLGFKSVMEIVQLLRKVADACQAIIYSIHEPAVEVFSIFDHLVLLFALGQAIRW